MKKIILSLIAFATYLSLGAQAPATIELPARSADRGTSAMKAFEQRQSLRNYTPTDLSAQDLGDLLWAANGFNRPDKRTAATAMNAQEIDIYVCLSDGSYLYNTREHSLDLVAEGDLRPDMGRGNEGIKPAACLIVVADMSRSPLLGREPEAAHRMAAYDAGIVSANIYIFCAANGMGTVCRAGMDKETLANGLKLGPEHVIHLNHPVGYIE
ncbi:MAG: SagB/ThcOx family dehydrogenase [Rikenellaceae bacterium]|nr:SagB/ThcOx family dehydrogenase [Rikenellaceae bacterium]